VGVGCRVAGPGALLLMPRRVREPIKVAADFKKSW
jgi:hypothetical protein